MANSGKSMKRMESRKSHSWWWDSHISPKNSKWLAENLEEMDRSVKRMLKLIEEDADSFAKKAEMYYRKRPELVALVEEFYRMYRSLAERYDHVTGELRKNVLSDLQTQGSGVSDAGSDFPTSPDHRQTHRKPGSRAAGFDLFLGSGGNSADMPHEGDESSSLTDSEPDSDASSVNNYASFLGNGSDSAISRKINELEFELREAKQKLQMQQEDNAENSFRGRKNENNEDLLDKVAEYEQELRLANERIRYSEEEISRLKIELQKFSPEYSHGLQDKDVNPESGTVLAQEVSEGSLEASGPNSTFPAMMEALRSTKAKLEDSEKETANLRHELEDYKSGSSEKLRQLQDQLELAKKEITTLKSKLNKEKKDVARLQERVAMLKSSLTDRDHEIRDLKMAVSDAEQKIFPEKAQIKAEMSKLLEQQACFEVQVKESESRCRSLEEEIRRINAEKAELKERLESEIKWLQEDIAEKVDQIEILNESLDASKQEKDELNVRSLKLEADVNSRDHQIAQMNMHLHRLHVEQAQLIASAEEARKLVEDLKSKTNELEKEIERQRVLIREGAEEKREAIRQLCFSLDHYRNNYHRLRRAFTGHKRVPVLAS